MTPEERITKLESESKNQEKRLDTMATDIREIKDKLLLRPSWAVTIIITFLSTLCASLTIFILTKGV